MNTTSNEYITRYDRDSTRPEDQVRRAMENLLEYIESEDYAKVDRHGRVKYSIRDASGFYCVFLGVLGYVGHSSRSNIEVEYRGYTMTLAGDYLKIHTTKLYNGKGYVDARSALKILKYIKSKMQEWGSPNFTLRGDERVANDLVWKRPEEILEVGPYEKTRMEKLMRALPAILVASSVVSWACIIYILLQ